MIPYRTESVHFSWLMNSATKKTLTAFLVQGVGSLEPSLPLNHEIQPLPWPGLCPPSLSSLPPPRTSLEYSKLSGRLALSRHDFVLSLAVLFRGSGPIYQYYSSGLLIIILYPKARF